MLLTELVEDRDAPVTVEDPFGTLALDGTG
jgi:hypothetical protein